MVEDVLVK